MRPFQTRRGRQAQENARPRPDFAATLRDGRRVVGRHSNEKWSIYVYAPDGRLLGYGTARARPGALERAGLSRDDAGEVLGRAGI